MHASSLCPAALTLRSFTGNGTCFGRFQRLLWRTRFRRNRFVLRASIVLIRRRIPVKTSVCRRESIGYSPGARHFYANAHRHSKIHASYIHTADDYSWQLKNKIGVPLVNIIKYILARFHISARNRRHSDILEYSKSQEKLEL